jgi:hypothetical protein
MLYELFVFNDFESLDLLPKANHFLFHQARCDGKFEGSQHHLKVLKHNQREDHVPYSPMSMEEISSLRKELGQFGFQLITRLPHPDRLVFEWKGRVIESGMVCLKHAESSNVVINVWSTDIWNSHERVKELQTSYQKYYGKEMIDKDCILEIKVEPYIICFI